MASRTKRKRGDEAGPSRSGLGDAGHNTRMDALQTQIADLRGQVAALQGTVDHMTSQALLRSTALPQAMMLALVAAVREAAVAGVTPLEAAAVRAHETREEKRKQLYASLLTPTSLQQGLSKVPASTLAASNSSGTPAGQSDEPDKPQPSAPPSNQSLKDESLKPGAYVKWCRKCRGAAREPCDDDGHITMTLYNAFHKLSLDSYTERELHRLMDRELGYAARIYVYVAPKRDLYYDLEFLGGTVFITMASNTLTYREALAMCDVLNYSTLTNRSPKDKFAKCDLRMEIPCTVFSKFPPRPENETLRTGAVLAKSSGFFESYPTCSTLKLFFRPVQAGEFTHYDRLIGYYESRGHGTAEDPMNVQWHKKADCDEEGCYQCCGKGRAPTAEIEDPSLLTNVGDGFDSDNTEKFFTSSEEDSSDEDSSDEDSSDEDSSENE